VNSLTDQQLLRDYTERKSEPAFAELVRRHVDFVYSAAVRMVCDTQLAEDVTQGAFLALAQNAPRLSDCLAISGWLHRTAQNLAAKTVRTDVRRRAREQEAAAMSELLSTETDTTWQEIAPHLDAALGELGDADRDALMLRYFERKSANEMAQTLGVSAEAAQKRVNRAVDRLRELFAKRGIAVGASGLVALVSANAVQAAPAALAGSISAAAALAGTAVQTSTAIAATKTIAMTTTQKTLVAAIIAASLSTPLLVGYYFMKPGRNTPAADDSLATAIDVRRDGAFGFPQQDAKVFCDQPGLRFSVWNNAEYFCAQAVLWNDDDPALGKTDDNREIGDWSNLLLDLDGDGKATRGVDRTYLLNPWPHMQGLHYQIVHSERGSSGLEKDSKGRGAIRHVTNSGGKQVRVDTYLIPMSEIARKVGDTIRICYWGRSPKPVLTVNSAGYERNRDNYYSYQIPRAMHHELDLTEGVEMDATRVPEGRTDISLSKKKTLPMPKVGELAPEISAADWINLNKPVTLKDLRGKVVLVEFWATWCGPCVDAIPHLNELNEKYPAKSFQLLSFVEEGHKTMDRFLIRKSVKYPIGLESTLLDDYGITGIPHAFILDRNGRVLWHGHSASPEMETILAAELKKTE